MEEQFPAWIAALETGYFPLRTLEQWADGQIDRLDGPPVWMIDVSLASSVETAAMVLWQARSASIEVGRCNYEADLRWGELWLGFLYLTFERGELGMAELLYRAGGKSDVCDCGINCEEFYYLFNEIRGGGPTIPSDRPLAERVTELFAPFADLARQSLGLLPTVPPTAFVS